VTTILDTVRHRTRVRLLPTLPTLQPDCSHAAGRCLLPTTEGGHVKYHPILLLMDERRFARVTRFAKRPRAGIVAVRDYALWLADRVGATGIRNCETEVQRLAQSARRYGVRCGALDALADPAGPAVARERALGSVITAIFQLRDEPGAAGAA
jgi:hypothetical protein